MRTERICLIKFQIVSHILEGCDDDSVLCENLLSSIEIRDQFVNLYLILITRLSFVC